MDSQASTPGSTSLQTLPSVPRPIEVQPHWARRFAPQPISSISMFELGAKNKFGQRLVEVDLQGERLMTMDQHGNKHSCSTRSDSTAKHETAEPLVRHVPRIPGAADHVSRELPNIAAALGITENRNLWEIMLDEASNAHERLSPFELDSLRRVIECNQVSPRGRSHPAQSAQGSHDHDRALHTHQTDPHRPGTLRRFATSLLVSPANRQYAPQPNFARPQVAVDRTHLPRPGDHRNFPLSQYPSTEVYSQYGGQRHRCQSINHVGRTVVDSEHPPQPLKGHNNPHHGYWSKEPNTPYGNPTLLSNSQHPDTHSFDAIHGAPGHATDVAPPEYQSPHPHSRIAPASDGVGPVEGPIADRLPETHPDSRLPSSRIVSLTRYGTTSLA